MDVDLDAAVLRYVGFFNSLTAETVEVFRELASPDVRYRDPLEDARGMDEALAYMHKWFETLDDLRFEVSGYARNGHLAFVHWRMIFRFKKSPAQLHELDGVSKIVFDEVGKVLDHIDYWDASPMLEGVPVAGRIVTLLKKLVAG